MSIGKRQKCGVRMEAPAETHLRLRIPGEGADLYVARIAGLREELSIRPTNTLFMAETLSGVSASYGLLWTCGHFSESSSAINFLGAVKR